MSTKENEFSIAAGTSAISTLQMKVIGAYSQPVYLIPGALPEGISVTIPSPVVGSQEVKLQVHAAIDVKPQTYAVTVYAAGAGENHSISFSVTVLPEGTAPSVQPEIAPTSVKLKPAERPQDKPQIGSHWVASWGSSAVIPSNDSGACYFNQRNDTGDRPSQYRHANWHTNPALQCTGEGFSFVWSGSCRSLGG